MLVQRVHRRYPSDLTDTEWVLIEPFVRARPGPGRPRALDLREVINALRSLNRTGCQWEYLPTDFPNQHSVRYYFDTYTYDGAWERINDALREQARGHLQRDPQPSGAIIDSQRVKTTEAGGERGYDGGKKGNGSQAPHHG